MAEFPMHPQHTGPARITQSEEHRARLAVASAATDVEDCRQLLDILGLMPAMNEERRAS